MATANRRWLALLLLVWMGFAHLMGAIFPLLGERAQELADIHELDGFGGFISRFLFTGAVLLPLVLLLTLHATGGLEGLVRRLTPSGRALERNKAGLALFQRGGYVAALAEFTEAVRLNPRLASAYTNRAAVHYQLNADFRKGEID